MKELEFVDEKTWKSEMVEFEDEHYAITERLHNYIGSDKTDLIVREDKKSICFGIRGSKDEFYRVTVENLGTPDE